MIRSRSIKTLNTENRHYIRRIKNNTRLWFDSTIFDDDESDFDPYMDFDPFDYMFFEDEHEYALEIAVHTPFRSLTYGTTSTSPLLKSKGIFTKPVYYDWGKNWKKVSRAILSLEVQESLKESIEKITKSDYLYNAYANYDEKVRWPLLYSLDLRHNSVVRAGLKKNYLSKRLIKEYNNRLANWYNAMGKRLIKEERMSLYEAEFARGRNLMSEYRSGCRLVQLILKDIDKSLFHDTSSPLRELLLFAPTKTNGFKPLLHKLAKLLSPAGTKLTVYESEVYCVVVDEERNIVFDNFLYFVPHVGCIYEGLSMASGGKWQNKHEIKKKSS